LGIGRTKPCHDVEAFVVHHASKRLVDASVDDGKITRDGDDGVMDLSVRGGREERSGEQYFFHD
jgi:hypothetical protein